jgi:uncharacterized SAM-binding protein YcdF (DUF218 family)
MFYALSKIIFFLLRPSNAIIFGLLLGIVLRWFGRRRSGTTIFVAAFLVLLASAFTALPSLLLAPLETRFPAVEPETPPTGIIILGGALDTVATARWGSPQLIDGAERIVVVADLARRYPDARLVYTGGRMDMIEGEEPEAVIAARVFETFGISPERLTIETTSRNTRENAVNTWDVVRPETGETWLLVTSAFHMPRAMGVFRTAGWTGMAAYPVDFRSLEGVPVLGRQFASEGLFLTDIVVKEWLGLVAYRFAGYTDALFPEP